MPVFAHFTVKNHVRLSKATNGSQRHFFEIFQPVFYLLNNFEV